MDVIENLPFPGRLVRKAGRRWRLVAPNGLPVATLHLPAGDDDPVRFVDGHELRPVLPTLVEQGLLVRTVLGRACRRLLLLRSSGPGRLDVVNLNRPVVLGTEPVVLHRGIDLETLEVIRDPGIADPDALRAWFWTVHSPPDGGRYVRTGDPRLADARIAETDPRLHMAMALAIEPVLGDPAVHDVSVFVDLPCRAIRDKAYFQVQDPTGRIDFSVAERRAATYLDASGADARSTWDADDVDRPFLLDERIASIQIEVPVSLSAQERAAMRKMAVEGRKALAALEQAAIRADATGEGS